MTALLLFSPSISAGGEEETLIWEECLAEARKNNPDLLSSEAEVEQARASKAATRSDLLPQISGTMSAGRSKSSGEEAGQSYSYGVSARQLIFDGLKSWYDLDQSEQSLIATLLDYDSTSAAIRLDLRSAFVELLQAQELIRITEDIARRRRQQAELVRLRYEAGREHRGSLLTAEANLAQAEFDITQARRDLRLAQKQLSKDMGRRVFTPITARGELELTIRPETEPDFERLRDGHPSVLKAAAERESARLELKSARADFFPEISGSASISRRDSEFPPDKENWSLGLSLSLPLFEGGGRFDETARAKAALREAEEEEKSERNDVLLSLQNAWIDLRDAHDNVIIQEKFLQADEERAKIAESQYTTGIMSFDNWIIIEDNLVRSQKSLLQSRAAALEAEAEWINAIGGTLDFPTSSDGTTIRQEN